MKRYRFGLETVLRIRKVEEEQARDVLLAANTELRRLHLHREQLRDNYAQLAADQHASSPGALMVEREKLQFAHGQILQIDQAITDQVTRVAYAQIAYRQAAARVEALLRLDERQRAEHVLAEQHEQSSLIDDLVTARYVRERTDGSTAILR